MTEKAGMITHMSEEKWKKRQKSCLDNTRPARAVNVCYSEIIGNQIAIMTAEWYTGEAVQASLNMDIIYPRITDGTDSIFSI